MPLAGLTRLVRWWCTDLHNILDGACRLGSAWHYIGLTSSGQTTLSDLSPSLHTPLDPWHSTAEGHSPLESGDDEDEGSRCWQVHWRDSDCGVPSQTPWEHTSGGSSVSSSKRGRNDIAEHLPAVVRHSPRRCMACRSSPCQHDEQKTSMSKTSPLYSNE